MSVSLVDDTVSMLTAAVDLVAVVEAVVKKKM